MNTTNSDNFSGIEQLPSDSPAEGVDILTRVMVVCREQPRIRALRYVVRTIDSIADCSKTWTLFRTVDSGSMRLIKRVLFFVDENSRQSEEQRRTMYKHGVEYAALMAKLSIVTLLYEHNPIALDVDECKIAIDVSWRESSNWHLISLQWMDDYWKRCSG